ncbi:MAG: AI-2E family transporter [Candidatus Falkowbacteria bacterium]
MPKEKRIAPEKLFSGKEINITTSTLFRIVMVGLLVYFAFLNQDILMALFVSLVFASALSPSVNWFERHKVPRSLSVLIIYLTVFVVFSLAIFLITPPIIKEVGQLSQNFPHYAEKIQNIYNSLKEYSSKVGILNSSSTKGLESINSALSGAAGNIFSLAGTIFGGIVSSILVLFLTYYMVAEEKVIKRLVWSLSPVGRRDYFLELFNRMQVKTGLWLRGQLLLCLSIFGLSLVFLMIMQFFFGMQYALVLAIIAGITEVIPYLGPTIGAIPAIFLAFTQSPFLALVVAIGYYLIQMIENNFLVPKIMEKTIGLNPIISLAAFVVGLNLAGIAGAVLSIPVAAAISLYIGDVLVHRRAGEKEPEFT